MPNNTKIMAIDENERYYEGEMEVTKDTRVKNKRMVLDKVIELFNELE